jgi:hypothetical protein
MRAKLSSFIFFYLIVYYLIFLILYNFRYSIEEYYILSALALLGAGYFYKLFIKLVFIHSKSFFSFGTIFCFFQIIFHLFSFFIFFFFNKIEMGGNLYNTYELWPVLINYGDPYKYIIQAEAYFIISSTLMIWGWISFNGLDFSKNVLGNKKSISDSRLIIIFIFLTIFNNLYLFIDDFNDSIGELEPVLNFSWLIILCLFLYNTNRKYSFFNNIFLPTILVLPFLIPALYSSMKEVILLALVPTLIGLWLLLNTKFKKLLFLGFFVIFFGVLSVYVSASRIIKASDQKISLNEVFKNIDTLLNESDVVYNLVQRILLRKNMMETSARGYYFIEKSEYHPEFGFKNSIPVLIPRILWKNKPKIIPAREFAIITSDAGEDSLDSDTAGFFTSLHMAHGFFFGLICAFLFGVIIAVLQLSAQRTLSPVAKILFLLFLFYYSIRLDESYPLEILPRVIITFIICGFIGLIYDKLLGNIFISKKIYN